MFTGIVEAIGTVTNLDPSPHGTTLTISTPPPSPILSDAHLGDSISINGTCLTITSFTSSSFTVGLAPETLRRTNLSLLSASSRVNLERAVSASTRMGGHFVQGHVDCVAEIIAKRQDGEAVVYRLRPVAPATEEGQAGGKEAQGQVMRWIVEKGYVTLDGASLTVTRVGGEGDSQGGGPWWEVMLVAYTQEKVVMGGKGVGGSVNVEVDMVGKYVEKSVRGYFEDMLRGGADDGTKVGGGGGGALERLVGRIVEEKLKQVGPGS